ncbi:hypothetical protein [Streptomyces morookaense]|uniref:Lipoprotein n=1 Tax=Streptomyces morookaense TaxID=1970 RepID=A0A7Y7EAK5_STRMO|nr:hypothetical protein [Streptomyces morookaense]NVK81586.1 hypothetical protein [Streptomyces morookaense]GHF03539.1 hypothetical protein GCM10010359_00340 [Streptomyces morookaense]
MRRKQHMRIKRILAVAAALAVLTSCKGGEDGSANGGGSSAKPPAGGGVAAPSVAGTPTANSLTEAQKYVQQYTSCENLGDGRAPDDRRFAHGSLTSVGKWSVTAAGVCDDRPDHGRIFLFTASDMKEFQAGYKKLVMDRLAKNPTYGLFRHVFVGENFSVEPTETKTAMTLATSGLRVLTCNPTFAVPDGYKKEQALVDGCVLSNFVDSTDGQGGAGPEHPKDEATPGGANGELRTPDANSMGLPRADSMADLKKLIGSSVDCKKFTTDPQSVDIQSIDYQPAVTGDPHAWGIGERGMCGYPASGGKRAHDLTWLDTVNDMATFQAKAKAAQLQDVQHDGHIKATASMVLVGRNIAVETNNQASRVGLYQQQFLRLNCEPGFSAPQGYRLEKASVPGCVLTNYEPGVDAG